MKYEKLAPGLASLVEDYGAQGAGGVAAAARSVALNAVAGAGTPTIDVFLRCQADANLDHLAPVAAIHQDAGAVRTATVALDQIDALSEDDQVVRIAPPRQLRPLLNVALPKVQVPAFRARAGLSGAGVIIGVVDSGIDPGHPAFAGRILSIWDQEIAGTGWGTTRYGKVLSGSTLGVSSDTHGHGTHVAGIAASADGTFTGVAPRADLVIVKTDFTNTHIADGVRYVFAEAAKLGRPAVVNLSLGGHFDAHDGTDDLSLAIDQATGQGRLVVAAAGNEGGSATHGRVTVPAGGQAVLPLRVPPSSQPGAPPFVLLNGWYAAAGQCEVRMRTSSGGLTAWQPVITTGSPARTYNFTGATVRVTTARASASSNGDHQFLVELRPGPFRGAVMGGRWELQLRNTGAVNTVVDVWSLVGEGARDATFDPSVAQDGLLVGSPGSASSVITVAAYTSRNSWTDSTGAGRAVGLTLDEIADFSSPGPLRSGALKPDLTAPGAMLVSCLSGQATPRPGMAINAFFMVDAGTSMASPLVAGLVALMLERDRNLTPSQAKALLQPHCSVPGQPAGHFDPKWGFGLIAAGGL